MVELGNQTAKVSGTVTLAEIVVSDGVDPNVDSCLDTVDLREDLAKSDPGVRSGFPHDATEATVEGREVLQLPSELANPNQHLGCG